MSTSLPCVNCIKTCFASVRVLPLCLASVPLWQANCCVRQHRARRAAQVEVEAVRPDPAAPAEELRLRVALLPVRVRADQRVCEFLAAFFAPPDDMVLVPAAPVPPLPPAAGTNDHEARPAAEDDGRDAEGAVPCCAVHARTSDEDFLPLACLSSRGGQAGLSRSMAQLPQPRMSVVCRTVNRALCGRGQGFNVVVAWSLGAAEAPLEDAMSLGAARAGGEPFIQRAEIGAWSLTIDYKPRRLDVAALRQGAFLEVRLALPTSPGSHPLRSIFAYFWKRKCLHICEHLGIEGHGSFRFACNLHPPAAPSHPRSARPAMRLFSLRQKTGTNNTRTKQRLPRAGVEPGALGRRGGGPAPPALCRPARLGGAGAGRHAGVHPGHHRQPGAAPPLLCACAQLSLYAPACQLC